VREKKFGSEVPRAFSEVAKQKNFLIYRGFSSRQVEMVFDLD
jgi:SOS response regulatory protein OraA/RecX